MKWVLTWNASVFLCYPALVWTDIQPHLAVFSFIFHSRSARFHQSELASRSRIISFNKRVGVAFQSMEPNNCFHRAMENPCDVTVHMRKMIWTHAFWEREPPVAVWKWQKIQHCFHCSTFHLFHAGIVRIMLSVHQLKSKWSPAIWLILEHEHFTQNGPPSKEHNSLQMFILCVSSVRRENKTCLNLRWFS